MLPELMPRAAQAAMPSEATITFTSVPCAENSAEPAYARMYFTLNDGSGNAVIVMGPVDGVTWVVARSEPFEGQASTDLVTAMTTTVTSARRQS